jgi:hypothetical protein
MIDTDILATSELDLGSALEETFGPPGGQFEELTEQREA